VGRRLLGGAIDLLPVLVGLYLANSAMSGSSSHAVGAPAAGDPAAPVAPAPFASLAMAYAAAGVGLYLLHTTVLELLFARSLGKFVTGLRVAALDGSKPA